METKYTTSTLATSKNMFSIPLYQRLFEWQEPEIIQLLNDLKLAFEKVPHQPYYIGMLTTYMPKGKNISDLVDGQQRFTVLMLMAIAFGWKEFHTVDSKVRLSFYARTKDAKYLKAKIENKVLTDVDYKNAKMELGIQCIKAFVDKLNEADRENFKNYIHKYLTFFVSELPESYQLTDLNRYFEAMNATGRGLENHEILKVKLLKELIDNNGLYTKIWNAVSDMDKRIIRKRGETDEFRNRQSNALRLINDFYSLSSQNNLSDLFMLCNNSDKSSGDLGDFKLIGEIDSKATPPDNQIRSTGERAILSFPEFLLQVLWLTEEKSKQTPNFFNVHKLQETFQVLANENVERFFQNLLKYRILFDYYIIRVGNTDQNSSNYSLAFKEDETASKDSKNLIQYQSMLYVSTSSNIWLSDALNYLARNANSVSADILLYELITKDNERRKEIESLSLKYGDLDRYWFWRLDYYLWEAEIGAPQKTAESEAIIKYTFKSNRSIEHLHPKSKPDGWSDLLNSFGNLAMISPGFNSTQGADDENVKFARIENQVIGKYQLESIKMLKMYEKAEKRHERWSQQLATEHGGEMIDVLINSFPDEDNYKSIRDSLKKNKPK